VFHRKLRGPVLLGACLLLGGCAKPHDFVDVEPPLPSTALLLTSWEPGCAFLVSRADRLLITSQRTLGQSSEVEVAFPVIENGKALVRRDALQQKARKVKANVLVSDPHRDLAILRVATLSDAVPELKLAAKSPEPENSVRLLGAAPKATMAWAYSSSTVSAVGPQQLSYSDGQAVKARFVDLNAEGKLAKGLSGGPVINEAGEVVGVVASPAAQAGQLRCLDVSEARVVLARAYCQLAKAARERRDYDKALAYCDLSIATHAGDADAFNERGVAYSFKDQLDKAIADYDAALKLDPKHVYAYRNRGSAYLAKGNCKKAVEDCSEAIKLNPKYVSAYEKRRDAYVKLKMKKEAEADDATIKELTKTIWKSLDKES
jgi:tetratricopeptide (TPR) repeat protein